MKREKFFRAVMAVTIMFAALTSAMATEKTLKVKIAREADGKEADVDNI